MKTVQNILALQQALLVPNNKDEMGRFLCDLLTKDEIREFARRWEVAGMLANKISYAKIEQKTGMSSTTIARISKFLQGKWGGYQLVLDRLHHHFKSVSPAGFDA